jgi:hypothetical protein
MPRPLSLPAALLTLAWLLTGEHTPAQEHPAPQSLKDLSRLGWDELECLYRAAPPGPVPEGYTRGLALYDRDRPLARPRAGVSRVLWHGKHFDPCAGMMVNQWLGFRAVHARVCYGPSWLDGGPSVVMDYRGTARVWGNVRDEVREVTPGLYLGIMFRDKGGRHCPQTFFGLEACRCAP